MTQLASWQQSYYMILTTGITNSPLFTDSIKIGTYGKAIPRILLKEDTSFEQNREVLTNKKATGLSYLSKTATSNYDKLLGKQAPSTSFNVDFDAGVLFIPLVTLLQDSTGVFVNDLTEKTFNPYTSAAVTYFAVLKKKLETNKSHLIKGAIAQSVSISGTEGEPLTVTIDWLGSDMDYDATTDATATISTASNRVVMFGDITFDWLDAKTTFLDVIGFDLTISNNATARYYNNHTPDNFILGQLSVEGTLKFPWGETTVGNNTFFGYLNHQTDFLFSIYNALFPTEIGDFKITINAECDNVVTNADDEIVNEITFSGIYDGTNPILKIELYDGISRSDP